MISFHIWSPPQFFFVFDFFYSLYVRLSNTLLTFPPGAPLQVFPLVHAGTPITPLTMPLGAPTVTPIRIIGSPTTPQNSHVNFLQKLKTVVPASNNVMSPVFPRQFDLTGAVAMSNGSPASLGSGSQTGGSYSRPPTPHTPVSHMTKLT